MKFSTISAIISTLLISTPVLAEDLTSNSTAWSKDTSVSVSAGATPKNIKYKEVQAKLKPGYSLITSTMNGQEIIQLVKPDNSLVNVTGDASSQTVYVLPEGITRLPLQNPNSASLVRPGKVLISDVQFSNFFTYQNTTQERTDTFITYDLSVNKKVLEDFIMSAGYDGAVIYGKGTLRYQNATVFAGTNNRFGVSYSHSDISIIGTNTDVGVQYKTGLGFVDFKYGYDSKVRLSAGVNF